MKTPEVTGFGPECITAHSLYSAPSIFSCKNPRTPQLLVPNPSSSLATGTVVSWLVSLGKEETGGSRASRLRGQPLRLGKPFLDSAAFWREEDYGK